MMSIHRTTALCLNPSLNKLKIYISAHRGRFRFQYISRTYKTSSSRFLYGGFIRRILEKVKSALTFTETSPALDVPLLSPIRGSSSGIVEPLKCNTQKYSLTVSNVKATFGNHVYILKKTVAKPRNVFPFNTIEFKSPDEESSRNDQLSLPASYKNSDESCYGNIGIYGILPSHLNPGKIFYGSSSPQRPNALPESNVSFKEDQSKNVEPKSAPNSKGTKKFTHTKNSLPLKENILSENQNSKNNPDLCSTITIKSPTHKYIDLHSYTPNSPKEGKIVCSDKKLADEGKKVGESLMNSGKIKSSDLNCTSVHLVENDNLEQHGCSLRNMMVLNPKVPRQRTIFYFHNKSAHVIKPSKFHDLNAVVEYISNVTCSNCSDKPARINFVEFHKSPIINSGVNSQYPATSSVESSGEDNHINDSNSIIYKKHTSVSFENTNNKFWIPNKVEDISQSRNNELINILGTCNNCHNKEISETETHEGSKSEFLLRESIDKPGPSKIPIGKDKLIEETTVPNKSILNIINSIDKSAVIIQKDLYITDQVIQKIRKDQKVKDDKNKLETSGLADESNGEQVLYLDIQSIEKDGRIKLCLFDLTNSSDDELTKIINPESLKISEKKKHSDSFKEFALLENSETGEILLLKPNLKFQEGLLSFSFVGNIKYKGISTTDLIKKAAAMLEKEKYRQKKLSESKEDHEKGMKKEFKKNEKSLPKQPNSTNFQPVCNNFSKSNNSVICLANVSKSSFENLPIKNAEKLNYIQKISDTNTDESSDCCNNHIKRKVPTKLTEEVFHVKHSSDEKTENGVTNAGASNIQFHDKNTCKFKSLRNIDLKEAPLNLSHENVELASDNKLETVLQGEEVQHSIAKPESSYKLPSSDYTDFKQLQKNNQINEHNWRVTKKDGENISDLNITMSPIHHQNSNNNSKDKQSITSRDSTSSISMIECPTLIDRSVECLMNSKDNHDGHDKSKNNPITKTTNLQGATIKERSPTMNHITKTSITAVRRNNTTDVNISEKETVIDSRMPVPFSTETFFQIVGTSHRLQNAANVIDSAKNQLMSLTVDNKTPTLTDIVAKLDEILKVIRPSSLKDETSVNIRKANSQSLQIPTGVGMSKRRRGKPLIAHKDQKNMLSRKLEKKSLGRKNRIRKRSVEIVPSKEGINNNVKENVSGKIRKLNEIKLKVAEKKDLIGEGIKNTIIKKPLTPKMKQELEGYSKVNDYKKNRSNLEPNKGSNSESKLDNIKNNLEHQSINNYVHLLKMTNKKSKSSKLKKKRVGFFGHKGLSKRDKKILKGILKSTPKKTKFPKTRRTKNFPLNSFLVKKESISASGGTDKKKSKTPVKDQPTGLGKKFTEKIKLALNPYVSKKENFDMKETRKSDRTKQTIPQNKSVTIEPHGNKTIGTTNRNEIVTKKGTISVSQDTSQDKSSQNKNKEGKQDKSSARQNKPSSGGKNINKQEKPEENKVLLNKKESPKQAASFSDKTQFNKPMGSPPKQELKFPQNKVNTPRKAANLANQEITNGKILNDKSERNITVSNENQNPKNPTGQFSDINQSQKVVSKLEGNAVFSSDQIISKNVNIPFSEKSPKKLVKSGKKRISTPKKNASTPKKSVKTPKTLSQKRNKISTPTEKEGKLKIPSTSQNVINNQFSPASNKKDRSFNDLVVKQPREIAKNFNLKPDKLSKVNDIEIKNPLTMNIDSNSKKEKNDIKNSMKPNQTTNNNENLSASKNEVKEIKEGQSNDDNASPIKNIDVKTDGNEQHKIFRDESESNQSTPVSKINPNLSAENLVSKRIIDEYKTEKPLKTLDVTKTKKNNDGLKKSTLNQLLPKKDSMSKKEDVSGQSGKESPSFQIYVAAKTSNNTKTPTKDGISHKPPLNGTTKDKQTLSDHNSLSKNVFKSTSPKMNNDEKNQDQNKTNITIIEKKITPNTNSSQHQEKFQSDLLNNIKKKIELRNPINFRVKPIKVMSPQREVTRTPSRKVASKDQKIISLNSKKVTNVKRKTFSPSQSTFKKPSKQKETYSFTRVYTPQKKQQAQEEYKQSHRKSSKNRINLESSPKEVKEKEKVESTKFDQPSTPSTIIKEKQFNALKESTLDKIKPQQEERLTNRTSVQNTIAKVKEDQQGMEEKNVNKLNTIKTQDIKKDEIIKKEKNNEEPKLILKPLGESKQTEHSLMSKKEIKEDINHVQIKKTDPKLTTQQVKDKNINFPSSHTGATADFKTAQKKPAKHDKEHISFPMLLVDLDKMSKEIKPDVNINKCHKCSVPINQIKDYPLTNPKKAGGFLCPKSILNICPSKDPMLRKELSFLPSVTRILNLTLPKMSRSILREWRRNMIRELGENGFKSFYKGQMTRGTQFHNLIQDHLVWGRGREIPSTLSFRSVHHILSGLKDLAAINSHVVHKNLAYRGVVDCVAKYKDKPVVVEWKRLDERGKLSPSSLENAFLQMSAYLGALNFDENYKFQVKGGIIVVAYSDGNKADIYEVNFQDCEKYWKLWLNRLQQYHSFVQNIN